ncbi:hypothetical protein [Carboxylicivirga marina]|uniref:hypothetical protein n=1 Tax=Carboxylicivirga marina TaxID=2800988 RepID=UPI0025938C36|nr:hypothetical protein [uncultured Carboxylicivirga sp.]
MPYQKDYILRMMEMMAEMIALFLGLLKKGDLQQASKRLNNTYRDFLKQDAAFFNKLPKEELTHSLLEKHHYTQEHLKVLAELFYAEGELLIKQNNSDKAIEVFKKSLYITEFVEKENATFSLTSNKRTLTIKNTIAFLSSKKH